MGSVVSAQTTVPRLLIRSPLGACLVVFCLAFAVRAFLLTKVPERYIVPHARYETTAIAMSLYERGEFADPYAIPTGPTAHVPPLYPLWLSLLYRVFGTSLRAGYIQWLFDIAFDSTVLAMLPWVAQRLGLGWPAGLVGGLAGAILPRWPATDQHLAAIGLALLLVAFLSRWEQRQASMPRLLLLGAGSGLAFHAQPALLPVVLGCLSFDVLWLSRRRARWSALMVVLGIVLAVVPWTWRNWVTFHELYFIRSNLGLELRIGNHDGAHPDVEVSDERRRLRHPRTIIEEAERVRDLGEAEYMRQAKAEAVAWIRAHPGEYARLVAMRVVYFWTGPIYLPVEGPIYLALLLLALAGAVKRTPSLSPPQRAAIFIPLATFPVVYYVVSWMPRYRIPIEWILILLAGSGVTYLARGRRRPPGP